MGIDRGAQQNEGRFKIIFERAGIGINVTSREGRLVQCNPGLARMLGYTTDELLSMRFADFTHPDDISQNMELFYQLLGGQRDHYHMEKRYIKKDGKTIWVRLTVSLLGENDRDGEPLLIAMTEDITEAKLGEQYLRRYQLLSENARDIILMLDTNGQVIESNQAAVRLYGYSRQELLTMNIRQLRHSATVDMVDHHIQQAGREGILLETVHQRKDGRSIPVEVSSQGAFIDGNFLLLSVIRDVSDRKKAEAKIDYLNRYDQLTGFLLRSHFEEQLRIFDTEDKLPLTMVIGDINGLKQINSLFGEHYGDLVLSLTAKIAREVCGPTAVMGRWSGDEFAFLLPNTSEQEAMALCDRIKILCGLRGRGLVKPNLAMGVATKGYKDQLTHDLCKAAEERMLRNKFLERKSLRSHLITSLTTSLRERNCETEEHAQRLQQLAQKMGSCLKLPADKMDELLLLAVLHDVGKIGVPDMILNKPGPLSASEWEVMKGHSEIGHRLAQSTPGLLPIAEAILTHHERWDGTGYPLGLNGEDIPLTSRILSIIDSFDVMTHERPYKQAISKQEALTELQRCAGSQFDPHLVQEFAHCVMERFTAR